MDWETPAYRTTFAPIRAEIDLNKFNTNETWKTLNNVLGRNKLVKLPDFFKDSDGNKITDSKKKLLITLTNSLPILVLN